MQRQRGGAAAWDNTARQFEKALSDWAATADRADDQRAADRAPPEAEPAAGAPAAPGAGVIAAESDEEGGKLELMSRIVSLSQAQDWAGLQALEREAFVLASQLRGKHTPGCFITHLRSRFLPREVSKVSVRCMPSARSVNHVHGGTVIPSSLAGTHPQAAAAIYKQLGEAGTQLAQLAAVDAQGFVGPDSDTLRSQRKLLLDNLRQGTWKEYLCQESLRKYWRCSRTNAVRWDAPDGFTANSPKGDPVCACVCVCVRV